MPKIVEGRVNSWYAERVLPEQGIFGDKETVAAAPRHAVRSSGSPRPSSAASLTPMTDGEPTRATGRHDLARWTRIVLLKLSGEAFAGDAGTASTARS
jgi:hypothetical protein